MRARDNAARAPRKTYARQSAHRPVARAHSKKRVSTTERRRAARATWPCAARLGQHARRCVLPRRLRSLLLALLCCLLRGLGSLFRSGFGWLLCRSLFGRSRFGRFLSGFGSLFGSFFRWRSLLGSGLRGFLRGL